MTDTNYRPYIPAAPYRVTWGFGAWENFDRISDAYAFMAKLAKRAEDLNDTLRFPHLIVDAPEVK